MFKYFLLLTFLLAFYASSALYGQEQNVNPGINSYYYDADYLDWKDTFETEGREVFDRKKTILKELNILPGMSVADIGSGTGLFTISFAKKVKPGGKVYAVDIASSFVENVLKHAELEGLRNVIGIVNDQHSTKLPENSIDIAFISNTYHHFEYPRSTLQSIHQALRKNGKMIIIDYKKIKGFSSGWIMGHMRLNKQHTIDEIISQGFHLIEEKNILYQNYYLVFNKIDEGF